MSTSAVRAGQAYVEIGARDKITNILNQTEKRLKSFGGAVSGVGRTMAMVGGAGVAALGGITVMFAGFDQGMSGVQAKTGASAEDMEKLRATAKELGATTKFSASEAAEGMNFLAMAGFNAQQIMEGLPGVLSLAAAGGVELGLAADIASDVSTAFGMTADEIGRVADVIAKTATSANTDVGMMGETFKYVAPIAKAAGQSLEEVSAAAGLLGNSGVKASMAGTDLKNILVQLSNVKVQKAMEDLGVSVKDADGEMRPMMDVLRDYNAATGNMSGPEKLAHATSLFGKISAKSAIILATSGDQVDVMRGKMLNAAGAADNMAAVMADNLGGAMTSFKSALEGVILEIGEALAPAIRFAIDTGTAWLRQLVDFIRNNQTLVKVLAIAVGIITGVGLALMFAGAVISGIGILIGGMTTAFTAAIPLIAALGAPFILVGLKIALVAALLTTATAVFFRFTETGQSLLGDLIGKFKQLVAFVGTVTKGVADALIEGNWGLAAQIGWAAVKVAFWKGAAMVVNIIAGIGPAIYKIITGTLESIGNNFVAMFKAIWAGLQRLRKLDFSGAMKTMRFKDQLVQAVATIEMPDEFANRKADEANAELQGLIDLAAKGREKEEPAKPDEPAAEETPAPEVPVVEPYVSDVKPVTNYVMPENLAEEIGADEEFDPLPSPELPDISQAQVTGPIAAGAMTLAAPPDLSNPDAFAADVVSQFDAAMLAAQQNPLITAIQPQLGPAVSPLAPAMPDPAADPFAWNFGVMDKLPPIDPDEVEVDIMGPLNNVPDGKSLGMESMAGGSSAAVGGTFSSHAAALMGAGGGGAIDRVARATERSQESLERIDRNMEVVANKEGPVFE